jgi:hypothetical protein
VDCGNGYVKARCYRITPCITSKWSDLYATRQCRAWKFSGFNPNDWEWCDRSRSSKRYWCTDP